MTIQVISNSESKPAEKTAANMAANQGKEDKEVETKSAPASEEKQERKTSKSDAEEAETHDEDDSDEADADEAEAKEDDSEKERPKKQNGFKKRIHKLNSRLSDKDREIEFLRRELDSRRSKDSDGEQEAKKEAKSGQAAKDTRPNPDDFNSQVEYLEALTDWKVEQREKAKEEAATKSKVLSEREQIEKSHAERIKSFAEENDDFWEQMENLADVPGSPTVEEVIKSSELGPALLYEMAKNPKEAARIAKLSPLAAARELGKLEAKLAKASATEDHEAKETKPTTKAPKPLDPVGGGKSSARRSIYDPNISQREYEELRREQLKRKGASW